MQHRASWGQLRRVIRKKGLLLPRSGNRSLSRARDGKEGTYLGKEGLQRGEHCFHRRQDKSELQGLEETAWLQGGLSLEVPHSFATHAAAFPPRHAPLPSKPDHLSSLQHVTGFILSSIKAIASLIRWRN